MKINNIFQNLVFCIKNENEILEKQEYTIKDEN